MLIITYSTQATLPKNENELQGKICEKFYKYTPHPSKPRLFDIVIDVETALKFQPYDIVSDIRKTTRNDIESAKQNVNPGSPSKVNERKILKSIREKKCFHLKADKGNKIVILEKSEYDIRMNELLNDGPYERIKNNPLNKMIKEFDTIRSENKTFEKNLQFSLIVSNPNVAKLYGLPKIHKLDWNVAF